jgi:hypothetical protein
MDRPLHERRLPRRRLDDYLHKPQRDYLAREFETAQRLGAVRWYFRLAPYPLDRDTAEAIRGIIDHQVLPWDLLQKHVEEWAYPEFFENAVATEVTFNRCSREDAVAVIPDLELLRSFFWGSVPDSEVDPWADRFADQCEILLSVIREGLLADEPSLAGEFVHMPFLPLGPNWLSRVPLLERAWIDRRIVELCEATALLADGGYYHLPAADPHSLAWHRFFPPKTRWTSPHTAPHSNFLDALRQSAAAVREMPGRTCQISGRTFVHVDDYAVWERRRVPDDLSSPGMRGDGIAWARWNAWVHANANGGVVEVAGHHVSGLGDKWDVRDGEALRIYPSSGQAELALGERLRALDQLSTAALRAAARSSPKSVYTDLQRRILTALAGRAMTADDLKDVLGCDRGTLFKPGGINELRDRGEVVNDRKVGGYFRPDCPPVLSKTGPLNGD